MSVVPAWAEAFDRLVADIDGTPIMSPEQGRRIWQHVIGHGARDLLDVGTCYGASAAYMAGALRYLGGGRVVTVDTNRFDDVSPANEIVGELLRRCGLAEWVDVVRMPHSSYAWWLLEEVERHVDADGHAVPAYDLVYVDGAKHLAIDAASALLAERLLRPGGWLLLDDRDWRHDQRPEYEPTTVLANGQRYPMSEAERVTPHIAKVFDRIVREHPSFDEFRLAADGQWAWARKGSSPRPRLRRTVSLDDGVPLRALLPAVGRRLARRIPRRR